MPDLPISALPAETTSLLPTDQFAINQAGTTKKVTWAQLVGWQNVKACGATGDGVTNDRTAVQLAITNASVAGGVVYFPPGTYLCNTAAGSGGPLAVAGNGVTLQGAGRAVSHIKAGNTADALIQCTNFSDFNIYDLDIDGNGNTQKIIEVASTGGVLSRGFIFARNRIRNNSATSAVWAVTFWDVQQASPYGGQLQRIRFLDNILEDCTSTIADQMQWAFCTDVVIRGNTFNNIGRTVVSFLSKDSVVSNNYFGTFLGTVSLVLSGQNDVVVGNTFDNCGFPVRFDMCTNGTFQGNILDNVDVQVGKIGPTNFDINIVGNRQKGVIVVSNNGGSVNTRVNISNNIVIATNSDHTIQIDANQVEIKVDGNVIGSAGTSNLIAIHVQSDYVIVRGNRIRDGRGGSATINNGVKLDAANHCLIEGNTIRDIVAGQQWYMEAGACDNNVVINNIVNGTGAATVVGASTVLFNNQGDEASSKGIVTGGALKLLAGTATIPPLQLTSGVNLTSALAGVLEYDGKAFYATPVASNRGLKPVIHFISQTADFTGTNVNTAQPIFNASTNGTITLPASTSYLMEGWFHIHTTGTTGHTFGILFGGTATLTSIDYMADTTNAATEVLGASQRIWFTAATINVLTASTATATHHSTFIKGIVRINGAGTFIPQYKWDVAPGVAGVTLRNSYFTLMPLGLNTVATVGNWS